MPKHLDLAENFIRAYEDALRPGGWLNWAGSKPGPASLEIHEFAHGGSAKVRGLSCASDLHARDEVIALPQELRLQRLDIEEPRFQASANGRLTAIGLWLAEKKAEVAGRSDELGLDHRERFWAAYVRALPTLEEYKASALPMAASDKELDALGKVPKFDVMVHWAKDVKKELAVALEKYNAERGARPKLKLEDALWGRAVAQTRNFLGFGLPTLAPLADFMTNGGSHSNVDVHYDFDSQKVVFAAKRDIPAGEELTYNYFSDEDEDSVNMLLKYGAMAEASVHPERWTARQCKEISQAKHWNEGDGPLLNAISQLIKQNCDGKEAIEHTSPRVHHVQERPPLQPHEIFKQPSWHFVDIAEETTPAPSFEQVQEQALPFPVCLFGYQAVLERKVNHRQLSCVQSTLKYSSFL